MFFIVKIKNLISDFFFELPGSQQNHAQVRLKYALGLRPFRPIESDGDLVSKILPFPYILGDKEMALWIGGSDGRGGGMG